MTRNELDAEELTQDTLLKAINHINDYNPTRAGMRTWLSRIAYRLTLNSLRSRHPIVIPMDEASAALREVDDGEVDRFFGAADNELTSCLLQAIDHLPQDEQTLITLFYYDDLPLREIAYITDAPPGTIATRLYRIRKKLFYIIQKLRQQ